MLQFVLQIARNALALLIVARVTSDLMWLLEETAHLFVLQDVLIVLLRELV